MSSEGGLRPLRWGSLEAPRPAVPIPVPPSPEDVAAALLRRAEAEAAGLRARAAAEAEELRAAAARAGRDEGFAAGRREGEAAAADALRAARAERTRARAERRAALRALEPELAALAVAIARAVLERELEMAPEEVVALARRLMQRTEGPARLRVHPDLAPVLEAEAATLPRPAQVVPDAAVDRGGLVLEGGEGVLEATVAGRLRRAAAPLEGGAVHG